MDEKKLYLDIWGIINANMTFFQNGMPKKVLPSLSAELVKFILSVIQKEVNHV